LELEGVLTREKFTSLVYPDEVTQLMLVLTSDAVLVPDPAEESGVRSADPDDDYLIALASHTRSVLVSGDKDLLDLSDQIPVYSPAQLRVLIEDAISDST
jgi:predicted nucleic acid-binding protein